jgi:hypothetical protein
MGSLPGRPAAPRRGSPKPRLRRNCDEHARFRGSACRVSAPLRSYATASVESSSVAESRGAPYALANMRLRRDPDPYRVPRNLEWVAALLAALIIVALLVYLAVVNLSVWD